MSLGNAVRAGVSAVRRSKRLVSLTAVATALLSLPAAVYAGREIHALGSRRPDATAIARSFDPDFFAELRSSNPGFDGSMTALVVVCTAIYLLLRPVVWGGSCAIAATDRRLPFGLWVREGGILYWKFLRLLCVGIVALWALSLATKPFLLWIDDLAKARPDDASAGRWRLTGEVVAFSFLLLVKLVLDHTKVGMRIHRSPGVFRELLRSASFVLHHPFRCFGVFLIARAVDLAAILVFAALIELADGAYVATSVAVAVLGLLLVASREAAALFHLAAVFTLRREVERMPVPPAPGEDQEPDLLDARLPWHEA